MEKLIHQIFSKSELVENPAVLIDVGASGEIHSKWRDIAKYCICVAFDADDREFSVSEENDNISFKKLYKFNCIVSDQTDEKLDFYLTKNPFCSSTLKPNPAVVGRYVYADSFEVDKVISINNITLPKVLAQLGIAKVDWLKTDSQGIDLRIYKSLSNELQDSILCVDFEPGLIASYHGEDTVFQVMAYMDEKRKFWLSGFDVQGVFKGKKSTYDKLFDSFLYKKLAKVTLKKAPKWVEMCYLNLPDSRENDSIREYLLACVFSLVNKEYINTIELADKGYELFKDDIFKSIRETTLSEIKKSFLHRNLFHEFEKKVKKIFS